MKKRPDFAGVALVMKPSPGSPPAKFRPQAVEDLGTIELFELKIDRLLVYHLTIAMMFSAQTAIATTLLALSALEASALPHYRRAGDVTLDQLNVITNGTTCEASNFPEECRTAEQALPHVNKAFADYGIETCGEKAALLSLMCFETGNFVFNINHFPGRPGQGTRNMMMFPFVHQYAVDTPSTSEQALALAGPDPNSPSITNDTMNAVRALVLGDELSFASASWFYKSSGPEKKGCTEDAAVVEGLKAGTIEGWSEYITKCVGTTVTPERQEGFERALNALSKA
ncbi:hypothetical protein PQX77_008588 [Marasmius sp. AFHP31]|nr:hypothetical protein PQX77_008588 [Marasmius sp. AFHP31]